MRLLIVEDEPEMNHILVTRLSHEGYNVDSCGSGTEALEYLKIAEYDGVILDVMLPGIDGIEVVRTARRKDIQVPILMLSARGEIKDIVTGLDVGADDYLVKPFDFQELFARLRVMLRSRVEIHQNLYKCDGLEVNTTTKTVTRDGKDIVLSPREYTILLYLIRNQEVVFSRQQILDNIYNIDRDVGSNVVDVYIRLLRKKVDKDYDKKLIHTIRGVGYVLKCEE